MNTTVKQATNIMEQLGEAAQLSVLKFAEFLATEDAEDDAFDVTLFDEATSNDDGYRISSMDLKKKYGIQS